MRLAILEISALGSWNSVFKCVIAAASAGASVSAAARQPATIKEVHNKAAMTPTRHRRLSPPGVTRPGGLQWGNNCDRMELRRLRRCFPTDQLPFAAGAHIHRGVQGCAARGSGI